jgi:hypothetical protein
MNIFIPPLGTKLTLLEDWHFELPDEYLNHRMIAILKAAPPARDIVRNATWRAILPVGTELVIRTIDVRQAQNGFEKIAFSAKIGKNPSTRFFVRGACANKIVASAEGVEEVKPNNAAVAAIVYALNNCDDDHDAAVFLRLWNEGDFNALRKEWPDIPAEVFIGADPLYKPSDKA